MKARFELEKWWVVVEATAFGGMFVAALWAAIANTRLDASNRVFAGASAALLLLIGWASFRRLLGINRLGVEISAKGIRNLRSPGWIAWRDVTAVRSRWQRADLISHSGDPVVIDFALKGADRLLGIAMKRAPLPSVVRSEFAMPARWRALRLSVVGLLVLGFAYGFASGGASVTAVVLAVALSLAVASMLVSEPLRVRVEPDALQVRSTLRSTAIPIVSVRRVEFDLVNVGIHGHRCTVRIETDAGSRKIHPAGADPFALYFAVRAALAQRAGK